LYSSPETPVLIFFSFFSFDVLVVLPIRQEIYVSFYRFHESLYHREFS
jgi:hypothetical protein